MIKLKPSPFFLLPSLLVMLSTLPGRLVAAPPIHYEVVYTDGTKIEGHRILKDHFLGHGRSDAYLDEHVIFAPGKQLHRFRNLNNDAYFTGPYIEFGNGDILPGQVVGIALARAGRNEPNHLRVHVSPPLATYTLSTDPFIRIRADRISRIVTDTPGVPSDAKGYVRLKSGETYEAKSLRWKSDGVRVLTAKEGIQSAPLQDLVEIKRSAKEQIRSLMAGIKEIGLASTGRQMIIQTAHGARITTREAKIVRHGDLMTMVQPSWALDGILLHHEDILEVVYLGLDELPLSILPAELLDTRTLLGFQWNWYRNRNVRGDRLASGDRSSSMGVGMHAYAAVAFDLPPDVVSFSSWLGLDRAVASGGCATASVYTNDLEGKPLWQSDFLRGGEPALRVGPVSIEHQKRLVLVADFGHEERPRGADPFDIRDEVDWIHPLLKISPTASDRPDLETVFPVLKGWEMTEQDRARLSPTQTWDRVRGRWVHVLKLATPAAPTGNEDIPTLPDTPGVHFEYYPDFKGSVLPNYDEMTPTTTGTISAICLRVPDMNDEYVTVRYRSTLMVPRDGFYTFYLESNDGSNLYLNNKLVVPNDTQHVSTEVQGDNIYLKKGGIPIRGEFFNHGGPMAMIVSWKGPGVPRQIIPPEAYNQTLIQPIPEVSGPPEFTPFDPIVLKQTVDVVSPNAWLVLYAGKGEDGFGDYSFKIRANGKTVPGRAGQSIHTLYQDPMRTGGGVWSLGKFTGQKIELEIVIKPSGYPGHELPSLYIHQLETGPEAQPSTAAATKLQELMGHWHLSGGQSVMRKNLSLSGADGELQIFGDGSTSLWLRDPAAVQRAGVGFVDAETAGLNFAFINGDWKSNQGFLSNDRKQLILEKPTDKDSWRLVFTRDQSSTFSRYAGMWYMKIENSELHNEFHSGSFIGGEGKWGIGLDGAFTLWLQYPPNADGQVKYEYITGNMRFEEGKPVFSYDNGTWQDDLGEWAAEGNRLTLREKIPGGKRTLVFIKH
ncbi:MAG: hypothetical protein ACI9TH_001712 [Kiritimatiellia bacterium]|jgi:hypothetical protein